jgi:PEP-CTERM motif
MPRSLIAPIALAGAMLFASQAQADTVEFAGFANGYETVNVAFGASLTSFTAAGGFEASLNGGPSFTTYCIDLYQAIQFGTPIADYAVVPGAAHAFDNANANIDIGRLYSAAHAVNDSTAQAAFQIAIWELTYETSGAYDLGSGAISFSGGTADSTGALAMAGAWLSTLPSASTFSVVTLESATGQDQVFATPVPEPSTYALMAGGLLGMGMMVRRRARRAD